jgi:hypothetical protein
VLGGLREPNSRATVANGVKKGRPTVIKKQLSAVEMKARSEQRAAQIELENRQAIWLPVVMLAARMR